MQRKERVSFVKSVKEDGHLYEYQKDYAPEISRKIGDSRAIRISSLNLFTSRSRNRLPGPGSPVRVKVRGQRCLHSWMSRSVFDLQGFSITHG